MKIAAVCCTFRRPEQLGWMIRCFERQTYVNRELLVLDDAGQYDTQQGNRWRLVSARERFASLGEKRNAAAAMVSDDVEALAVWDDDDLYLPWALQASVAALNEADWSRPSLVLHPRPDGQLQQHRTGGLFHGGWAYRREVFRRVGGYPSINNGEDQALAQRFEQARIRQFDPLGPNTKPFYVYCWQNGGWHLSGMGADGYERLGTADAVRAPLQVTDPPHVDLAQPRILPMIRPRVF